MTNESFRPGIEEDQVLESLSKWVVKYIFLSFRHSQGDPGLQELLDKYVVDYHREQVSDLRRLDKGQINQSLAELVTKYFKNSKRTEGHDHKHSNEGEISEEVSGAVGRFLGLAYLYDMNRSMVRAENLVENIAMGLLKRDIYFLTRSERRNAPNEEANNKSYIQEHVVNGSTTGDAALDAMYAEVKLYLINMLSADSGSEQEEVKNYLQTLNIDYSALLASV